MVIVLVALFIFFRQTTARQAAGPGDEASRLATRMMEVQGKYIVAVAGSFGMNRERAYAQSEQMNQGPVAHRIRYVVLAGELAGPDEAIKHLHELNRLLEQHGKQPDSTQQQVMAVLESLYADYAQAKWAGPSLSAGERELLKSQLGWYGLLALGPRRGDETGTESQERQQALRDARQVMTVVLTGSLLAFLLLGAGFIGAIAFFVLAFMGKIRSSLDAGSRFSGIYAETFAVWMLLSIGIGFAAAQFPLGTDRLLLTGIVSFSTLAALFWPLWRGVSARQLFRDVGILEQPGRAAWLEPFWGLVGYVSALPLLAAGLFITAILMAAFGGTGGGDEFSMPAAPKHPITDMIGDGGAIVWLKMFFVASVVAPIVEETMFRGILYRHLRDATARLRVAVSVLISGAVSSFIFAIMHPQGIFAVPVLTALAFGFCLAREWRGSIVAPVTMHAINNGVVTLTLFLLHSF